MNILIAAMAGFFATIPMTLFMELLFYFLPKKEKYPLPPREISMKIADKLAFKKKLTPRGKSNFIYLAHFAYGAGAGMIYSFLISPLSISNGLYGCVFGLLVWALSYLVGLPLFSIIRPATEHPARRNILMIGAHIVWGFCLGHFVRLLSSYATV